MKLLHTTRRYFLWKFRDNTTATEATANGTLLFFLSGKSEDAPKSQ